MELSKRLQAVADLVTPGLPVADVGTDHGYIPIYLVKSGKNPSAIAMDINRGPLKKAEENIARHGLSGYIETRLSDGAAGLAPREASCIIAAGMGGGLIIKIIRESCGHVEDGTEWVLQPQSELWKVRQYLMEAGYRTIAEDMVLDDGKFYPMMKVKKELKEKDGIPNLSEEYSFMELCYGKLLLRQRHPVLRQYLEKEYQAKNDILVKLSRTDSKGSAARREEISKEIQMTEKALRIFQSKESICFVEKL